MTDSDIETPQDPPRARGVGLLLAAIAFTGFGVVAGMYAARDGSMPQAAADANPPEDGLAADSHMSFSAAALRNMGVETGTLELSSWSRTVRVLATIESSPLAERRIHAPVGGRVLGLPAAAAGIGRSLTPGTPLVELLREPIPLPTLELTAEAVHPMHGELHAALRNLVRSRAEARIARTELERLTEFADEQQPVIPRQRVLELEYTIRRAEVLVGQSEHELELHGLSEQQIEALAAGEHGLDLDADNVRRALDHRGQWSELAQQLDATIPEPWRTLPLVAGTVGELAGSGKIDAALIEWWTTDPRAAAMVLPIGALLLGGHSTADVRDLHEQGALHDVVEIGVPDSAGEVGWELRQLPVQHGALVSAGDLLAVLRDLTRVRLVAHPVGSEVSAILRAIETGAPLVAEPMIPGAGPRLEIPRLQQVTDHATSDDVVAWAEIENRNPQRPSDATDPTASASRPATVTWALRPGTRYRLRVPVAERHDVFVIPRSAVTDDGPDRIVFLPDDHGDEFEEIPITVAAEDDRVVVLDPMQQDPRLASGTRIVIAGAFEIGLALHAGDQHAAGHGHDH